MSEEQRKCSKLSSAARTKIVRKKWTLDAEENIVNVEKKYVVPKRHLHKILSEAHSSTWHRGRDKTEIKLRKLRKLPCNCSKHHNWVLYVHDHFSKYSWLLPLKHKETQEVASSLESLFWMFGFPTTLNSDNGKEFKSKVMTDFWAKH